MQRTLLKSKIHRATLTDANLNYTGSLTVDEDLMEAADLVEFEKIQLYNINNGARLETYVIKGERGSGTIGLNGAAARHGLPGDLVIVVSFVELDEQEVNAHKPKLVYVNEKNRIEKIL